MLYTAYGVAGVIGPQVGSSVFVRAHSYQAAFDSAAVLAAIALVCELLAQRPAVPVSRTDSGTALPNTPSSPPATR
jgi:predicted MFS family arabinose efflux permease